MHNKILRKKFNGRFEEKFKKWQKSGIFKDAR